MIEDRRAVVWVADDRVAPGLDYGVRLVERLEGHGYRVTRRDLTAALDPVPAASLHVLSGGGTSVSDRAGWMPAALALTRELVDGACRGHHSVLGVCLGAQMVAESRWPGAVRETARIEVGLTEVTWRANGAAPYPIVVPAFHYEVVDRGPVLAGGGEVIADNSPAGLQAFRLGWRVWGVQFHPELTPDDLRALVAYHRQTIESHGGTVAAALATVVGLERRWSPATFGQVLDRIPR